MAPPSCNQPFSPVISCSHVEKQQPLYILWSTFTPAEISAGWASLTARSQSHLSTIWWYRTIRYLRHWKKTQTMWFFLGSTAENIPKIERHSDLPSPSGVINATRTSYCNGVKDIELGVFWVDEWVSKLKQSRQIPIGHIRGKGFDGNSDLTQNQLVDPGEKPDLFAPSEKSWSQDSPLPYSSSVKASQQETSPWKKCAQWDLPGRHSSTRGEIKAQISKPLQGILQGIWGTTPRSQRIMWQCSRTLG